MLQAHECYQAIKQLDLTEVLKEIDKLEFIDSKGVCAMVSKPDGYCPESLLQLVRSCNLKGKYYRVFCRKLMPKQGIDPHVDEHDWLKAKNIRRYQIPLVSHPDIKMRWPEDNIEVHLEPGWLYEVRYDRLHEVVNNTDSERIHIQIDMET